MIKQADAYRIKRLQELAILQYMDLVLPKRTRTFDMPDGLDIRTYDRSMRGDLIQRSTTRMRTRSTVRPCGACDRRTTWSQDIRQLVDSIPTLVDCLSGPATRRAVLINRSTKQGQAELVYIGIGPDVRGRRWGRTLLQHGIRLAVEARVGTLSLAVDIANSPALKLYDSLGFVPTGRRRAVIRSIRGMQES